MPHCRVYGGGLGSGGACSAGREIDSNTVHVVVGVSRALCWDRSGFVGPGASQRCPGMSSARGLAAVNAVRARLASSAAGRDLRRFEDDYLSAVSGTG